MPMCWSGNARANVRAAANPGPTPILSGLSLCNGSWGCEFHVSVFEGDGDQEWVRDLSSEVKEERKVWYVSLITPRPAIFDCPARMRMISIVLKCIEIGIWNLDSVGFRLQQKSCIIIVVINLV